MIAAGPATPAPAQTPPLPIDVNPVAPAALPVQVPGGLGLGPIELEGLRNARIFDPRTRRFTQVGHMHYGRWYMSTVLLPDGKVFAAGGVTKLVKNTALFNVRPTETFNPATGQWTEHEADVGLNSSLPLYPRMWLMPNGKIFYDGNGQNWGPFGQSPDEAEWALQRFYNLQTNRWEVVGPAPNGVRSGALDTMLPLKPPYDRATILTAGGVAGPSPGSLVAQTISGLTSVDRRGRVTSTPTAPLNHARWFSQAVTLPDGTVAAFSGGDKDEVIDPGTERPVRQIELFDPATRRWTPGPVDPRDRTYHNTAILLPDARVLVGGHSPIANAYGYVHDNAGFANNERDASFEIYSPPYLFRGPRPRIAAVQSGIPWGRTFTVRTRDAARVRSVVLSTLPATTHVLDNNQRTIELAFTHARGSRAGDTLNVKAPPNGTVAPPGGYYLFINADPRARSGGRSRPGGRRQRGHVPAFTGQAGAGSRGVPSVARIVMLGRRANRRPAIQPFPDDARVPSGSATPDQNTAAALPGECAGCPPNQRAAVLAPLPPLPKLPLPPPPAATPVPTLPVGAPAQAGSLSRPFEEGGAAEPRCRRGTAGYIVCKPAAVSTVVLTDGRILYWDGLAGEENTRAFVLDGGELMRNSEARVLDLRSGTPKWSKPTPVDGGAVNPEIAAGRSPDNSGRVRANGSPTLNDGDMFCAYQVHLADGRVLITGGTDWYSDPSLPFPPPRLLG